MPLQLGAPGVYIEEIPSGRRVIRSVSTSIGAFIDFFREGPMNEAIQIFGTSEFDRIFGGYDALSEASFAIPQFFLNGGTQAYVIRVAAEDGANPLESAGVLLSDGTADILRLDAANPGTWGNLLRVDIDHLPPGPVATRTHFNLRVTRFASMQGNAQGLVTETYLNLSMDSTDTRYALTVINDGSSLVVAGLPNPLAPPAATDRPAATGTRGDPATDLSALTQPALDALGTQSIHLNIDREVGADVNQDVALNWAADDVLVGDLSALRARVESAIRSSDPTNPSLAGTRVTVLDNGLRVQLGRSGAAYEPTEILQITEPGGDHAALTLGLLDGGGGEVSNVQHYMLGRDSADGARAALTPIPSSEGVGSNGLQPGPTEILGMSGEPPTGMHALDLVDLFNILCIPRAADLTDTQMDAVVTNAISYCEDQRAFMIVDIPSTIDTITEVTEWLDGNAQYRSENAAVYFPRIHVPDPTDEFRLRSIGASGTMAGVYARTDTARGVWKAPAGIEALLEGVSELAAPMTDPQNGVINPLGINALRTFPVYGTIAWGSRTLVGADALASEWAYIPVRRLALMLEESLFRGTKWVVFEPNDEPTWANIRLNIGAFMNGLFQQGAFQGATPRDAYYVKCDSETTTQNDIDQGIVNIEVGFAPLKPAEFVVIRFRQIVGQVEV